ncbi:MAG TPA: AraC family transcriptional regulator [Polyangiaceae bacterium]|jgi:AraC-like DNA-binding protein|nr:AraC family transcriptional regulator [Polyangiaceae bacterium]
MRQSAPRVYYQPFLPGQGTERSFVWKYAQAIGGRRPRHFHAEPELNLVIRGSATFAIGSKVVRVSPGELLAFPPGQDHALLEGSPDLYLYAIGLDPAYSAQVLGHTGGLPLHVTITSPELHSIDDRASAIVDRSSTHSLAAELWEHIHWVGLRAAPRTKQATHVLTRRAVQLLSEAPELGLDKVARYVRAHPSEVSRHFHRDMGITLVRYRTRLRLLQFIRQVDSGERDLMTSASVAGFGSYSQAHRSFQAELGCAPRQFFSEGLREQMQAMYSAL